MENAFQNLRHVPKSPPVLAIPNFKGPVFKETDAFSVEVDAVLEQR